MNRPPCLDCCRKHLFQARAILLEVQKGYPHFWSFAIGHLAEAEDEIVAAYPMFAAQIRDIRKQVTDARGNFNPDWELLAKRLDEIWAEEQKTAKPASELLALFTNGEGQ